MERKDFYAKEQMIKDIKNLIENYVKKINSSDYYHIDYVFSMAVSNPEETLGGIGMVVADFHTAEILIDDLNRNNYTFSFDNDSTMVDFYNGYAKDGQC
jgi:hypothetical protein